MEFHCGEEQSISLVWTQGLKDCYFTHVLISNTPDNHCIIQIIAALAIGHSFRLSPLFFGKPILPLRPLFQIYLAFSLEISHF